MSSRWMRSSSSISASLSRMIGAARRRESVLHRDEFVADDAHHARARAKNIEIVGDLGGELVQAPRRFRRARARSGGRRRNSRMARACASDRRHRAVLRQHVARIGDQRDQRRHVARRPGALHQRLARGGGVGRGADEADHFVDIGDRDGQADLQMGAVARLGQQMLGAPGDDFLAEFDEGRPACPSASASADARRSARSYWRRSSTASR